MIVVLGFSSAHNVGEKWLSRFFENDQEVVVVVSVEDFLSEWVSIKTWLEIRLTSLTLSCPSKDLKVSFQSQKHQQDAKETHGLEKDDGSDHVCDTCVTAVSDCQQRWC
jgi:hypothetical protein